MISEESVARCKFFHLVQAWHLRHKKYCSPEFLTLLALKLPPRGPVVFIDMNTDVYTCRRQRFYFNM